MKKIIFLTLCGLLCVHGVAKAENKSVADSTQLELSSRESKNESLHASLKEEPALPNALLEAAERGEEKARRRQALKSDVTALSSEAPSEQAPNARTQSKADLDQVLLSLVDEVQALKSKVVVVSRTEKATQNPEERKSIGSRTVYNYKDGAIFEIHAGVDRVTDIELGLGETLTNPPVSGDTVRWKVSVLESEKAGQKSTHIIVKPIEEAIETNLILTTNKNVYHFRLMASDWYMPAVSFNYPEDEAKALEAMNQRKKLQERVAVSPDKLNFSYDIEGRKYDWKPRQVFDDGEKTYIKMPQNLKTSEAPALFVLSRDDDLMLVNYRVKGDFYIVDRLIERAEMRVGKSERVEIISDRDNRSFFERNF
jgi:P-type conjugative transfer protein TrbG